MKKLKLDIDHIRVDSFAAEAEAPGRGTVNAHATPVLACAPSGGGSCDSCFPNYCPREPNDSSAC